MRFRYCYACGKKKPLTEEYFDLSRKGSHSYKKVCKECMSRYEEMMSGSLPEETPRQKLIEKCIKFMKGINGRTPMYVPSREAVGLSAAELADHLMMTFRENYGYDWDGKCAVDIHHITPLHTAEIAEDLPILWSYENLQLLKTEDHRKIHQVYK